MDFDALLDDIESMTGQLLYSIRPGCEITIEDVRRIDKSIRIRTSRGKLVSRPFSEMQTLWDALATQPLIRVEDVLRGSGSSRNQPETILANLPYMEWLRYDGKKHIAYVGHSTHALGTLREMSPQDAAAVRAQAESNGSESEYSALFVTEDVVATGNALSKKLGNVVSPLQEGFYKCEIGDESILVCTDTAVDLQQGVYTFINPGHSPASVDGRIKIGRHVYAYINIDGGRFLSREQ